MHPDVPALITLLVAAVAIAVGAKRLQIPYNVGLVVGGMLLALSGVLPVVPRLTPEVVFLVCLPLLLFEGGVTADLHGIRANAVPIGMLATAGMALAVAATGASLRFLLALDWGPALLLGCILAVTDTVSILYAFRRAPVPPRLAGIMTGESLFNDGTALVAYATLTAVLLGGHFTAPAIVARVVLASAGGLLIGLGLGLVAVFVMRRTHDPLAEIMVTTATAFAAFTAAEQLHASGAIAAVTAGLAVGGALRAQLSPQSQVAIHTFWEYAAFGVNTFLFLSVGLSTSLDSLGAHWAATLVAIACVLAGRAVAVYLPFLVLAWVRPAQAVPVRWQHVFLAGNVKGALSIGLALGLGPDTPDRALIVDVAFGVTFISLLVQGLSLSRVLGALGLLREDPVASAIAAEQATLIGARAARQELEALQAAGLVPKVGYEVLRSDYQVEIASAERELRRLGDAHLAEGARLLLTTRRRLLDAQRTALQSARASGLLPQDVAEHRLARLDAQMLEVETQLHGRDEERRDGRPTQRGGEA